MLLEEYNFLGVDYGSKLSGTTAAVFVQNGQFNIIQSLKKKNADMMLSGLLEEYAPQDLFIDAPLSLPGALVGRGEDYFYRKADRLCKAMSPMFLGAMTARAIKLKDSFSSIGFYEAYPAGLVREIPGLQAYYDKKKSIRKAAVDALEQILPVELNKKPENWHQYDALLCWMVGYRFKKGEALAVGDAQEGLIYI